MSEEAHAFDLEVGDVPSPSLLTTLGVVTVDTRESPLRANPPIPAPFPRLIRDTQDTIQKRVVALVLDEATEASVCRVFPVFASLWNAEAMIFRAWVHEEPHENYRTLSGQSAKPSRWLSAKATRRLGNDGCARFASAAHARKRIANELWKKGGDSFAAVPYLVGDRGTSFARAILITDFGLAVAEEVLRRRSDPRLPVAFVAWLSAHTMEYSREAYGLLAVPAHLRSGNSTAAQ